MKKIFVCLMALCFAAVPSFAQHEKLDYSAVTTYQDFADYEELDLVCQCDGKRIYIIKDGTHGFSNPAHKIETINHALEFLNKHTK